ncbi:hypothetical protein PSHI8_23520 [Polynucleobacter sp. SHI8]|uniref:hypothetical protein n=1 Tax=unclassified Polynucleobacter TaxID=2640945 RepID=UPI002493B7A1|nr:MULTISPECIES: hypothetical protein [unclassified Polynucleobacter]BDW12268.1 hypothetical protein PSHI2_23500 [Polynucleobacter sp. SHI2]BDW14716.1 hypothetical protein PSHI8_23520 [Polynucleobacter sp. SHI8]
MRLLFSRVLPFFLLIFTSFSHAVFLDEIQVYDGEINEPGEFGLEIHANTTFSGQTSSSFPNQRVSQGGVRLTPEFSYGLTKTVELGFYLPTNYTPDYGYESAGYKTRIKWLPIQNSDTQPWALGGNFEYSVLNTGMEFPRKGAQFRGIVAWKNDQWSLAFNPVIDSGRSDGQNSDWELNYQTRAIRLTNIGPITGYGLEYYQGQTAVNNSTPNSTPKQIFAILELQTSGTFLNGMNVHMGLGYGWDAGDQWTLKMIFSPKI